MGKRLRVQRRGRGSPTFRAPTHKRIAPSRYFPREVGSSDVVKATVEDLVHETGRGAPLAVAKLESGETFHVVAPEGLSVGGEMQIGPAERPEIGDAIPLGKITPGLFVSNLERFPGDGGKLVRSSGTYASVVSHTGEGTLVKLPSGKAIFLDDRCFATVGVVSGSGRTDKPFVKAGKKQSWMSAKGRVYPMSKGVAMNPVTHPHGGGSHKSGSLRPTTIARNAPPGQKVGLIAAKQTGRSKKRRRV